MNEIVKKSTDHTDDELVMINRISGENWLRDHTEYLEKLDEGCLIHDLWPNGELSSASRRRRANAGIDYGLLVQTGSQAYFKVQFTPYARDLLEEMGLSG